MAQADSQSTTRRAFLGSPEKLLAADTLISPIAAPVPEAAAASGCKASDPIFAAIEAHKRALDQRNQTIEALCAAEERQKNEERETWER
jgi:hypothetical protein